MNNNKKIVRKRPLRKNENYPVGLVNYKASSIDSIYILK